MRARATWAWMVRSTLASPSCTVCDRGKSYSLGIRATRGGELPPVVLALAGAELVDSMGESGTGTSSKRALLQLPRRVAPAPAIGGDLVGELMAAGVHRRPCSLGSVFPKRGRPRISYIFNR